MDLTVRPVIEADFPAVHEMHAAQNDFGGWFTNPFAGGKEARFEDLKPAERWLHGGPWMDPHLLALHVRRYADAGGTILVADGKKGLLGSVELWPGVEPLPYDAYLDIEVLITQPPDEAAIERVLIDAALREARNRDLRALDIAPLHCGVDDARLKAAGFRILTEHRTVHLRADRKPEPPDYEVVSTAPSYGDLRDFVALNHAEPASFRLGNLGNEWAAGLLREVSHPFSGLLQVDYAAVGVTGRVMSWLPEREADVDFSLPTRMQGNVPWFRRAVAAAIDYVGRHHRVALFRTTVPASLIDPLGELGFEDGQEPDPWLRKHLASRNL